jgi:hypothetical protein
VQEDVLAAIGKRALDSSNLSRSNFYKETPVLWYEIPYFFPEILLWWWFGGEAVSPFSLNSLYYAGS